VLHRADGLYAIGSGAAYAIGALEAGATPTEAVEIASRNDVMTGLPTQTIKQEKRDD
jgi:ATP-dependent protease HslVU (ClpYQ) peptidase subunit